MIDREFTPEWDDAKAATQYLRVRGDVYFETLLKLRSSAHRNGPINHVTIGKAIDKAQDTIGSESSTIRPPTRYYNDRRSSVDDSVVESAHPSWYPLALKKLEENYPEISGEVWEQIVTENARRQISKREGR